MTFVAMEDYFADATDRLLGGEPLDQIVADYPAPVRHELQALLAVVELADQVATSGLPQRIPINRITARVKFSQRASELREELAATNTPLPMSAPPVRVTAQPGHITQLWRRWTTAWSSLGAPAPLMRLAPLTLLLIALYLSTFTVVATAQAALPGDFAYPMKSWMREQRVATAPAEAQPAERWRADQALAEDVAARAEQLQSEPDAAPLTAVSMLQFRGFDGDNLLIGDLKVVPWHQPEGADEDEWLPIAIEGELQPGAVVMLRYQIVPGASDTVQGIALNVMQAAPMPTPAPTPTPTPGRHCQRIQAPNWVTYIVKQGETLSEIAARSQTSVSELRRVNCLTDGILRTGTKIFVPATILGALPPAPPPVVVTAVATSAPLPTATTYVPTVTPSPPTSAPTITPEPTAIQGGDADATATLPPEAGTATAAPTSSASPVATVTPATPAATEIEPSATATSATPMMTALPTATAPATTEPAATEPAATEPAATEPAATATPDAPTPTAAPAMEATATTQPVATVAAPLAQDTVAPTALPPTPAPPTPAPPTEMPVDAGSPTTTP